MTEKFDSIYKHQRIVADGNIEEREEEVIYGSKGFSFKLYIRNGKDKEKFIGKYDKEDSNKYRYIHITNDDKKVTEDLTLTNLLKEVKKNKDLAFVSDFAAKNVKTGGAKKMKKLI